MEDAYSYDGEIYYCEYCDKEYKTERGILNHLENVHDYVPVAEVEEEIAKIEVDTGDGVPPFLRKE